MSTDFKQAFLNFRTQIDALDTTELEAAELTRAQPGALSGDRARWVRTVDQLKSDIASTVDDVLRLLAA